MADRDRDSRRGVDVVRVGNALITHSFVASRNIAESEDNAGRADPRVVATPAADAQRRRSSALERLQRLSTNRGSRDPVDPNLREVLQALMHLLRPTEHCRLLTSLDIANAGAQRATGSVVMQQKQAPPPLKKSSMTGGVLGKLLRRTSSQPELALRATGSATPARGARGSNEYFVALISNRQSGTEEDAVFILRARAVSHRQRGHAAGADASGKVVRRAASLQKLPRAAPQRPRRSKPGAAQTAKPNFASTPAGSGLRRAESFVADSLQAAAAAAPVVDLDIVKVMPVWSDLRIKLRGRGLLRLTSAGESIRVATVSVRSMWRLVSSLQRARALAKASNFFPQGPSHQWISLYLSDDLAQLDDKFDAAFATSADSAAKAAADPSSPAAAATPAASASAAKGGNNDDDDDDDEADEEDDEDATSVSALSGLGLDHHHHAASSEPRSRHAQRRASRRGSDGSSGTDAEHEAAVAQLASQASQAGSVSGARLSLASRERAEAAVVGEIRLIIGRCRNLDELTTGEVVRQLEEKLGQELMTHFKKSFIDEKIMLIYGQQEPPSRIAPGLYLGTEYNAANFSELTDIGVQDIINVTKEIKNFFPDLFDYYRVSVKDHEKADLGAHLAEVVAHIVRARERGRTVLVHCQRGISRSASVVIAYLMTVERSSCAEATLKVEQQRPVIKPNRGFKKQLIKYEASLRSGRR